MNNHNFQKCKDGVINQKCHECVFGNVSRCCKEGEWSNWGEWTACTKECGNETKSRNRTCSGFGSPGCPETGCSGNSVDEENCDHNDCESKISINPLTL